MRNKMKKVLVIIATTIMNCTNDGPSGMTLDDLIDAADNSYETEETEEKYSEQLFVLCDELLAPGGVEKVISEWENAMKDCEGGEEALKNLYAQYGVEM